MLATILPLLENQLSALADAWLSQGANAVELWSGACLLACWPPDSADRPATASITAPILVGGSEVGLLRVSGVSGGATQQRLATDAALIARLDDDQAIIVLKGTRTSSGVCVSRSTTIRLDLPALPASLDILAAAIETILKQYTALEDPEKTIYETRLAIHELCVNIIEHAYGGAREKTTGYIAMTITLIPFPHRLIVETYDTGEPFDPSRVPEPDLLGERGRGLQLIRALMDEVSYLARNEQTWHTTKGQPWQTEVRKPPQPGRNCWYLVKLL